MSVAALTMDDQRPLMNSFDSMKKQYDHITNTGGVTAATIGGGCVAVGAPPSGPASPTPSTSEEPQHHHHHHHHSAHHHHHQPHHQQHQLQQPTTTSSLPSLTLQSQQPQLPYDAAAAVAVAEQRQRLLEEELESVKLEQTRLSQQCIDAQRREKILMRRLANKEQEFQDYVSQIAEYKAAQAPGPAALRSALLDPAVNLLFEKLKKELKATKAKLEETQNELSAWKFTPDSNTGKRLMAKCRLLYQENEELGKMTSNGRLAKLETELAMQKSFSEEVKKSQSELDDFLQELDEDVEGMQSTILFLQQELKTTRDRIQILEKENLQLKNGDSNENTTDDADAQQQMQHLALNGNGNNMVNSTANIINNIINSQLPANVNNVNVAMPLIANNNKFQSLETIDENMFLHTNPIILPTPPITTKEFYNGIEEQPTIIAGDEGSNNSSSSNNSVCNKNTRIAVVARKRNFDESEIIENVVLPVPQIIATPRTLPPKKSKLRVTPARRASMQSADMLENDNNMLLAGVGSMVTTGNNLIPDALSATPLNPVNPPFVDNAVVGMANEEVGGLVIALDEDNNSSGGGSVAPQRIMTRRRSLRNQPNGDSNH